MPNALDVIQVKYGQKTGEEKTISYLSFLELDSSNLSENEEKLQQVMKKLYHLNENKYPLYNVFSDWQVDKPLTLNLIEKPFENNYDGAFHKYRNDIRFNEMAFDNSKLFLTLVHELKHAEDSTKESYDFENECRLNDGLSYHQIGILLESRAKACELTVLMMDCLDQKKSVEEFVSKMNGYSLGYLCKAIIPEIKKRYEKALETGTLLDAQDMQQMATVAIVPYFIVSRLYKYDYFPYYNKSCEIKPRDNGIKKLPDSWNILPQYHEPLLTVLNGSFKNGEINGMVPTDVLKKLNVAFDISAFLCLALEKGLLEDIKALIQQGADINFKDGRGDTLLHDAVYYGREKSVEVLLKAGADLSVKNKYGYAPMHLAVRRSHINIVKALIKAGADLSLKNKYGETPLDDAYRELILDQEREPSRKLTDQERQNLLKTIDFLEKQKAPHGRCLKEQVDEIRKKNGSKLVNKKNVNSEKKGHSLNKESLIWCAVMSVTSFILGLANNDLTDDLKERDGSSAKMDYSLTGSHNGEGAGQKGMPEISMVDATLMMLKDKNLDEKEKNALVLTTLLLIEKGQMPTPKHLNEVLNDPTVKALFEQYELGKTVVSEALRAENISQQEKANTPTPVCLQRKPVCYLNTTVSALRAGAVRGN